MARIPFVKYISVSRSYWRVSCQHLERTGLPSTIHTKQAKALRERIEWIPSKHREGQYQFNYNQLATILKNFEALPLWFSGKQDDANFGFLVFRHRVCEEGPVNATVGAWPFGSTVCSTLMLCHKMLNTNQGYDMHQFLSYCYHLTRFLLTSPLEIPKQSELTARCFPVFLDRYI